MPASSSYRPRHPIRVVLSPTALLPFVSMWKAAAAPMAQLAVAGFFVSGVAVSALGASAGWFVLAATLLAGFVRAIDIESWGLLIPGGLVSAVQQALGSRGAHVASAAALVERLLLVALASVVLGHYIVSVTVTGAVGTRLTGFVRPEDVATVFAVSAVGLLWVRARLGVRSLRRETPRIVRPEHSATHIDSAASADNGHGPVADRHSTRIPARLRADTADPGRG
jgi:hypothetical protein